MDCKGQCYDGISDIVASKTDVEMRIKKIEPRTMRIAKLMVVSLEAGFELNKLIKYSPKRKGIFNRVRDKVPVRAT